MLLTEALVVGLANGLVGSLIAAAIMSLQPDFSLRRYGFWPQVFLSFFLTGIVLHLLFEALGANRWYCTKGHACRAQ